jgi:tetratricopeptide (TPR) repeat protein
MRQPPVSFLPACLAFFLLLSPLSGQDTGGNPVPEKGVEAPVQEEPVQAEPIPDGHKLLEAGRLEEAFDAFRRRIEIEPTNAALHRGAGRAAYLLGDYSAAINTLTTSLELEPSSYEATLLRAQAFAAQGRELFYSGEQNDGYMMLQDASAMFSAAAELKAASAEPFLEKAGIHLELSEYDEADSAAIGALTRDSACHRALLIRGDVAFMRFREAGAGGLSAGEVKTIWNSAMALYVEAQSLDPNDTGAYLGMAALFEADKKWDEASESIMKALVLDPELLSGYDRLISLLGNAEGREKLVALLGTLIKNIAKRFPGDRKRQATPFYYTGFAHFLNFDWKASIDAYKLALKANPEYRTGATYYIARARFALNDFDKSARDFFRVIMSDPDGFAYFLSNDSRREDVCTALSYLSNHCYEAGSLAMARDLISGILLVRKSDSNTYNNYAFLCRETGAYEDSYAAYSEALSLEPDNPSTLNDTALILQYHLRRDLDYARELYGRAVKEARRVLQDETATTSDKDNARIALRDASDNLRKMGRGEKKRKRDKIGG